ncbi:NusG domain II-containing protein [Propionivibrio limicola]|uniref:NusG domain II-containing protein n=1 Tax=Propionivibrio limicola TaxID=167645 RepID=UPI00129199EC|nr:NusG domain II-containing protein [Propionivibrio limicola]
MHWLSLLKPGDWLLAVLGLALCILSFPLAWHGGSAEKVVVKKSGEVFAELDLSRDKTIEVPGPLGMTKIAVEKRRVRVVSDPGPHQYCVRQGWLEQPGEIAICAPNQVSLQITGGKESYDSLSY